MKINDVIKKCIKIPGISIKQAEYSMELILNTKEGKGSMTFFHFSRSVSGIYFYKFSNLDGSRPSIRQLHYKRSIAS